TAKQPCLSPEIERVPTDVRDFETPIRVTRQPCYATGDRAESRGFGCLVASVEQPLHADADSKERSSRRDGAVDGLAPGSIQPGGGAEVSDTRHDHAARLPALLRHRRHDEVGAERRQRLAHRGQIASAVINECNHSSPFVLGSIFASRASFAHATRSARANALNTASM